MARKRKPRYKDQGVDFIIRYLRNLIKDERSSPSIVLACIDRLAIIDQCYEVELNGAMRPPTRMPIPPVEPPAPAPEPEPEPVEDDGQDLLDDFNRSVTNKILTRGNNAAAENSNT